MNEAAAQYPGGRIETKHVLCDGDLVAVHSHLIDPHGGPDAITYRLFRFKGNKIVEIWDVFQRIPANSPNKFAE